MLTVIFLLLSILFCFILWWTYNFHTYWRKQGVKGPNLWRSLMSYTKVLPENDWQLYEEYGNVIGFYEIFKRGLIINDPKLIKDVLVKDFHLFTNRRYYCFGDVFDSGIVLAKDDNWRRIRSVVSHAFTSSKLKVMFDKICEIGDQFCENISKEALKGEFDIKFFVNGFVMDVLCSCGYGIDIESIKNPNHPIVMNARKAFEMDLDFAKVMGYVWPSMAKWLKIQAINSDSVEFFRKLSQQIMSDRRAKRRDQMQDLMQLLIDANQESDDRRSRPLSLDEITATAMTIFIGGYDTTAATLSHVCYYLAQNMNCQQNLFEELSAIKDLKEDSLMECKFMNAVIKETLRVAPVGCRFDRVAKEDYVLGNTGIVVPKGCLLTFSAHTVHHKPDLYPNPNVFNPTRFLDKSSNFDEFSYLGWGLGPRMCVGMSFALNEMRIFIYKLVMNFELSMTTNYKLNYPKGNLLYLPNKVLIMASRRK